MKKLLFLFVFCVHSFVAMEKTDSVTVIKASFGHMYFEEEFYVHPFVNYDKKLIDILNDCEGDSERIAKTLKELSDQGHIPSTLQRAYVFYSNKNRKRARKWNRKVFNGSDDSLKTIAAYNIALLYTHQLYQQNFTDQDVLFKKVKKWYKKARDRRQTCNDKWRVEDEIAASKVAAEIQFDSCGDMDDTLHLDELAVNNGWTS